MFSNQVPIQTEPLPTIARMTPQNARDYRRVAAALRFVEAHRTEQPDLQRIAKAAGLSEFHLHRLFLRWAGVTPKRFLQFLTKEHAKRLLARGATVLQTAHATGMSGGGRLHDLLVTTEGASPGEIRSAYAGIPVSWGVHPSPFGGCVIATTARGICGLKFVEYGTTGVEIEEDLRTDFPRATLHRDDRGTRDLARRVFNPAAGDASIAVHLRGTPFQLRVWQALLALPAGSVCSYGDVARAVGAPSSTRAVGGAIGENPVAYLIPCHRVIRAIGEFGNYAWGGERKRAILAWESAQDP